MSLPNAIKKLEKEIPNVNEELLEAWQGEGDITDWYCGNEDDAMSYGHQVGFYQGYMTALNKLKEL